MAQVSKLDGGFDRSLFEDAACAFGVFDGVHLGHQAIIEGMVRTARADGGSAVVMTFDIDPDEVFVPGFKKLMPNEARIEALATSGADAVVVLPFTERLRSLDPQSFLERTFGNTMLGSMHVGRDFRFGCKASGTVDDLRLWADKSGAAVYAYELEEQDGSPITSTRIRAALAAGDVATAAALLGRPYALTAQVDHGRGEGAGFGIRTANLRVPDDLCAVGEGVYAGYALVDGARYKAAVNVGLARTFEEAARDNLEAHLLDFEGDLYGKPLDVQFVEWLRPQRTFGSTDELVATITANIDWVRENL